MNTQKTFQIHGPVIPSENYFVERREAMAEFISRIERGRYIVIFAPRQTGKTSFFRQAVDKLSEDDSYIPILLNFEVYADVTSEMFYQNVQMLLSRQLNIQDEFELKNFTKEQVQELLAQYTSEVGQVFDNEVIRLIHEKTSGQPFLVNRLSQILTEEIGIPKTEPITTEHFQEALHLLLKEDNTHFDTLVKNVRQREEFKNILLKIIGREGGVPFNRRYDIHKELTTYGVIKEREGMCIIENPIYQNIIIDAFKPRENGAEDQYLPENATFDDYITPDGQIQMEELLGNFCDFIQRAVRSSAIHCASNGDKSPHYERGFLDRRLVPQTPREFVGQYLLLGYLDIFVRQIGAEIYPEVPTGRGRMDIILLYKKQKYIIETKLFYNEKRYQNGKRQLAEYLKREGTQVGYYIVFDHRVQAENKKEKENINSKIIFSYCIPALQPRPSTRTAGKPDNRKAGKTW